MKIIHFSEIKDQVNESQIRRRIEFMSKYSHPGISKLRAIMHSKNSLFLVFDLQEGELFNTLAKSGPLHEDVARRYFQLIDILSFIKSHDASHRDLKSENLLVDSSDNLVISDFTFSNMTKKSDIEKHKEEEENEEEDRENDKNALKPLKRTLRYYTAPEVFQEIFLLMQ